MEEKKATVPHMVEIKKRQKGRVTGVKDVLSFSEESILLLTEEGKIQIKGAQLHILSLDLVDGVLTMEGRMDSFVYLSKGESGQENSFWKRMFH